VDVRLNPHRRWSRLRTSLLAGIVVLAMPATASAQWHGGDDRDDDKPQITRGPKVRGEALVGARLEAHEASWRGSGHVAVLYTWLRCESESWWSCTIARSSADAAYTPTADDVGHQMRVWLTVSNHDGRDDDVSEATSAVVAPPPPPPPPPPPAPAPVVAPPPAASGEVLPEVTSGAKLMRPFPVVRIRGWLSRRGAMVQRLTVSAPRGAQITIRCLGRRCPRSRWARTTRTTRITRAKAFEGYLRAGTRLEVRVTRAGRIGKHTLIRIRHGKPPTRTDRCLYPGSKEPRECPAA
jgi:hypothetical protein